MLGPRILTGIKIPQCPIWSNRTDYLFQNTKKNGTVPVIWRLLKRCKDYEVLITAGSRFAQLFGFYRTVSGRKKPKHIILELMLDEARSDILWKIKVFFQKICFSSVDVVFVSARGEVTSYAQRLGLPEDRIRFLPFHTNIINPRMVPSTGRYIFSAGRTGRDFATLSGAVEGLDVKVVVVSDKTNMQGVTFPPNVEVYCDISYEKYMELLYGCELVVVPLKKLIKSTGQVVFLEAMALGKPVIATAAIGTEDYIEHGVTGVLVPPGDINALSEALVNFIKHPEAYQAFAVQALKQIKEKHTFEAYTNAILETATNLWLESKQIG